MPTLTLTQPHLKSFQELYEKYREKDGGDGAPDQIGPEGIMEMCSDMGLEPTDVKLLILAWCFQVGNAIPSPNNPWFPHYIVTAVETSFSDVWCRRFRQQNINLNLQRTLALNLQEPGVRAVLEIRDESRDTDKTMGAETAGGRAGLLQ